MNNSRGSIWRKWDLHIHTNASDGKDGCKEVIEQAKAQNLSVIAVTDHHTAKNVDEMKSLGRKEDVEVISGIEFRSEYGKKSVHFIGLFPDNFNNTTLDSKALHDVILSKLSLSETEIIAKGKSDKPQLGDEAAFKNGMFLLQCNFKEAADLIHEWGGVVVVHAGSKTNSLDQEMDHEGKKDTTLYNSLGTVKKELFEKNYIDICEIRKAEDNKEFYLQNFGKPSITCSDAHKANDVGSSFTWIKADPTFEGLKQIIYEPKMRVNLEPHEPDFKEEKLVIDEIKFTCNNNLFTPESIKFNKNLNVIIGGKSSGKSVLLYHLARTLETNNEVLDKVGDKYKFIDSGIGFDLEVKSMSGIRQKLTESEGSSIIPNVKYIPQNYLSELAEPQRNKKGEDLLKLVRKLLLEDDEYKVAYEDFLSRVKSYDKNREDLINNYFSLKEHIESKQRDLKELGSKEALEKNIELNSNRINELKKGLGLTDQQVKEYSSKREKLAELEAELNNISSDFRNISVFNRETLNVLKELLNKKELAEKAIIIDTSRKIFNEKYKFLGSAIGEIESYVESHRLVDKKFVNPNEFVDMIRTNRTKQNEIKKFLEPLIQNEQVKQEIAKIEELVKNDRQSLQQIEKLKKEITDNNNEIVKEKQRLFDLYTKSQHEYPEIVTKLLERTSFSENETHLKINGSTKFNIRRFEKELRAISDGRRIHITTEKYTNLFDHERTEDLIDFGISHFEEIKGIFDEIEMGLYPLSQKIKAKQAIKVLLDDYFVDYWQTEYEGDEMGKMSTGKASFVILMLIIGLSNDKAPILIDQPEDNLDNRSISKDLVTYLRAKKLERQIILVTHNPNVVVNGDAENVIIANQKGQNDGDTSSPYQFDYINGSIEDTRTKDELETDLLKSMGIREHITDIVEGGKEAFKKREEKYGF